jgi:hypothetical protein
MSSSIPTPINPIIDLSDSGSEFDPSQLSREASIATNVTGDTNPFWDSIIEVNNRRDQEEQDRKDALKAVFDAEADKENIPLKAEVLHNPKVKVEEEERNRRSHI